MTKQSGTDLFAAAFFLADHAAVENGKVYTNGAFWSRLNFAAYPALASFAVVAVLSVPWRAHHKEINIKGWFEDADGNRIGAGFDGVLQVGSPPEAKVGDATIVPLAIQVGNFTIPRPGDYAAVLSAENLVLDRWEFRAQQHVTVATPPHKSEPDE